MRIGQATGFQVVFLMFAVMLLAVPAADLVATLAGYDPRLKGLVVQGTQFALAIAVILAFPGLRRLAAAELARPVPRAFRAEVSLLAVAKIALAFAATAVLAGWLWLHHGPAGLEGLRVDGDREYARAFSGPGLARLFLAVLVAPVVEEIVCRGFLYRAFERQWGWFASMLLTSTVFGLYHPHFWSSFASSIVYVCVLRRTGSLRAAICVHAVYNMMLWWPLLGQHVFPHGAAPAEPSTWHFHVACLAFVAIALPTYVWLSRDPRATAPTVMLEPHGALPR